MNHEYNVLGKQVTATLVFPWRFNFFFNKLSRLIIHQIFNMSGYIDERVIPAFEISLEKGEIEKD